MKRPSPVPPEKKAGIHPRNRNNDRYDFPALISQYPELGQFVFVNAHKKETIDFSNPAAVRTLNAVLLKHHYGIAFWEIPPDHLCPPIPGRADYIHHLADLLASNHDGAIPTGRNISVLDIGVGANCIYPLIGNAEYGWRFVGTDVDPSAVSSAQRIVDMNDIPSERIEIRLQHTPDQFFRDIIRPGEFYDLSLCNPPFHSSIEEAITGTQRKWKNLGTIRSSAMVLNFGGRHHELVYPGGEIEFIAGMIRESALFARNVLWFTSIVSKQSNVPVIQRELKSHNAVSIRTVDMAQGQKKVRFIAWTFLDHAEHLRWKEVRW